MYCICLTIYSVSWKLDCVLNLPISLIGSIITIYAAFDVADGNVDCYLDPSAIAGYMSSRWALVIAGFTISSH